MKKNKEPNLCGDAFEVLAVIAAFLILGWLIFAGIKTLIDCGAEKREESAAVEESAGDARRYLTGYRLDFGQKTAERENAAQGGLPQSVGGSEEDWFAPEEAEVVFEEGEDGSEFVNDMNVVCKDIGCTEYNTGASDVLVGWDGHTCERWEMALFSRIVFWEFYGTSEACCVAGADSMLNLWASGYFGKTLGELLSARAENGALVYTTYAWAWDEVYDPEGLAWCRELCEKRFYEGPTSGSQAFFQLYGFPAWAQPCFVIDGVYFSTFKEE